MRTDIRKTSVCFSYSRSDLVGGTELMFVWFRTFVWGHPRAILTATGRRVGKLARVRLGRLFVYFRTTVRVGYEFRAKVLCPFAITSPDSQGRALSRFSRLVLSGSGQSPAGSDRVRFGVLKPALRLRWGKVRFSRIWLISIKLRAIYALSIAVVVTLIS